MAREVGAPWPTNPRRTPQVKAGDASRLTKIELVGSQVITLLGVCLVAIGMKAAF